MDWSIITVWFMLGHLWNNIREKGSWHTTYLLPKCLLLSLKKGTNKNSFIIPSLIVHSSPSVKSLLQYTCVPLGSANAALSSFLSASVGREWSVTQQHAGNKRWWSDNMMRHTLNIPEMFVRTAETRPVWFYTQYSYTPTRNFKVRFLHVSKKLFTSIYRDVFTMQWVVRN